MTLDISNLSPEKRAFLKAHPNLLANLEKEVPKQIVGIGKRKKKLNKGKAKWQRGLENVDRRVNEVKRKAAKLRRDWMMDRSLRDAQRKFMDKVKLETGPQQLICPRCEEGDKGNRMNGKPWCFKCEKPLIQKDRVEEWKKLPTIRIARDALKKELKRLNPGLEPDNKR